MRVSPEGIFSPEPTNCMPYRLSVEIDQHGTYFYNFNRLRVISKKLS